MNLYDALDAPYTYMCRLAQRQQAPPQHLPNHCRQRQRQHITRQEYLADTASHVGPARQQPSKVAISWHLRTRKTRLATREETTASYATVLLHLFFTTTLPQKLRGCDAV